MLKGIRSWIVRSACLGAAALVFGGFSAQAQAAEEPTTAAVEAAAEKSPYTLSLGTDFTSHFISYGVDVWGGGTKASPFSSDSTIFAYGTLTCAFTPELSGFVNVWSDINDNADSSIGGSVQEIDLNVGLTYTMGKFAFTAANGCWLYAGETEGIFDFTVAYADGGEFTKGFALNPVFVIHSRYKGNGAQDTGAAFVPGIKPTITMMKDGKYPMTVFFPVNVAFFTDDFQGGDSGYGYFSAGAGVSVPLAFIPEKYGAWNFAATITYYNTPEDSIPSNPEENFFVSALSIGMSF